MPSYIALIHKDAGSDYGVSFPDLPGCATAGTTLDEARTFAAEALALHLLGIMEDGEAASEPSSLEDIMSDPESRDVVAVLVSAKGRGPKPCGSISRCRKTFSLVSMLMRRKPA
jgi:predicted RNase H-like HicB family nuclease